MAWSKNVLEERDAPDQFVIGAMNTHYCVLEVWWAIGGAANHFLFGDSNNPETNKKFVSEVLKHDVWDSANFLQMAANDGQVSTHSLRKFASTFARRSGCSKDDVDSRGHWKRQRVVDRYIDLALPYPNAKAAAALCVGGPCKYVLKADSGVSVQWLCEYVVPNIIRSHRFQPQVALVLALPIFWASFADEMEAYMPPELRNCIRLAYANIRRFNRMKIQ